MRVKWVELIIRGSRDNSMTEGAVPTYLSAAEYNSAKINETIPYRRVTVSRGRLF